MGATPSQGELEPALRRTEEPFVGLAEACAKAGLPEQSYGEIRAWCERQGETQIAFLLREQAFSLVADEVGLKPAEAQRLRQEVLHQAALAQSEGATAPPRGCAEMLNECSVGTAKGLGVVCFPAPPPIPANYQVPRDDCEDWGSDHGDDHHKHCGQATDFDSD
eukprot:gnl/TRDRNA2_/TRDRNA2_198748_c0_seq1.p1 gnl/TRDRNA2_/TRDRNA2_198748_c0~~gnl/TRDRNA2_/TRDRNA2_198748_c0_seq1.p1  ORF type:complete len:190 (-),score=21.88 gnl/TRDRNA2_/TRDRNA2_198748_c0_seq1:37-528(-)